VNSASSACVVLGIDDAHPPSVVCLRSQKDQRVKFSFRRQVSWTQWARWLAPVLLAGWGQKQKRCLTSI
jgi:hypothetical protein